MEALGWVDLTLLAVLLLSLVLGLWRGFVLEVLALLGWVAAWFAAQWLAPIWAPHVPIGERQSELNAAATWLLAFLAVLIVWGLASRVLRSLISATPLRGPDRLLGAVFGLLRGVLLLLVAAVVAAMTPLAQSPDWRSAHGVRWLDLALVNLKPLLPPDLAQFLPT